MKPMYTLLLTCAAFGCRTAASVPRDRAGNGDLVDAIKLNLRNNNDDYTDAVKSTTIPTYSKDEIKNLRRADNYVNGEIFDNNPNDLEKNNSDINSTNGYRRNIIGNWKITPLVTDTKLHTLSTNRSKFENFQKFVDRNQDLFKEFVSSKLAARTKSVRGMKLKGHKGIGRKTDGNKGWLEDESGTTPHFDPDRLDMLPAIGGRIHYWRLQGRLCHRHVMKPEGPKYDSRGRVYLPAHGDARRPFNATRRPKLLLPKCCNCCKKSVLGCE